MPQLHLYVPEAIAKQLRARARAAGMSVSRYIASVVRQGLGQGWPDGFFEKTAGGWRGEPLKRGPQGGMEDREDL